MAISDELAKIKETSATLNGKTDDLNDTIAFIEQQLQSSGVGIEFWWTAGPTLGLHLRRTESGRERDYFVLGFSKLGGAWHVAVQHRIDVCIGTSDEWEEMDEGDPAPLVRAPRRIRLEATEHLEQFLRELHTALQKMVNLVDKAKALVTEDEGLVRPKGPTLARDVHDIIAEAKTRMIQGSTSPDWWRNFVDERWLAIEAKLTKLRYALGDALGRDGKVRGAAKISVTDLEAFEALCRESESIIKREIDSQLPKAPSRQVEQKFGATLVKLMGTLQQIEASDQGRRF